MLELALGGMGWLNTARLRGAEVAVGLTGTLKAEVVLGAKGTVAAGGCGRGCRLACTAGAATPAGVAEPAGDCACAGRGQCGGGGCRMASMPADGARFSQSGLTTVRLAEINSSSWHV